jgi:hypothetical protein
MDIETLAAYIARILNPNVSSPTQWTYSDLEHRCNDRIFHHAISVMQDMGWVEYHGDPRSIAGTLILTAEGTAALLK